ncbi:hypothetical protein FSP39_007922 [Pinctada imbricata]|uniref:Uncharacterized protein n=1 Tax=Pinctada imbricata TaxID=66713 RepID=A0AA88Y835_PINIB|nr:hypothetical protein FSP39_007922 [Pinctada imbricata]
MKEQERLAMEHKKRLEEEKKNRQHVTESFRYSVAMEELMSDDKVKKVIASKHTVSKVTKSEDGREIRIMGPAVLTSVNKADLEEIIHKRRTRRFTTAIMKERNPTLVRVRTRNSVASYHPQRKNEADKRTNQEQRMNNYRRQISSRLILPTITETDRRAQRINIKAMS